MATTSSRKASQTQYIRTLLDRKDPTELQSLLRSATQLAELTAPAQSVLADGLVESKRWTELQMAFTSGPPSLFSEWLSNSLFASKQRQLSHYLNFETVDRLFTGDSHTQWTAALARDLALRTAMYGEWPLWEQFKDHPVFNDILFAGGEKGILSQELLRVQYLHAGKMPNDLKQRALDLAAKGHFWDTASPLLTTWGGINHKDPGACRIHDLFLKGDFEMASEVADHFRVQFYGDSGRGPIDSAFMSGRFEAVEGLLHHHPLLALRPVLESSHRGRLELHIPFHAFLEDALHSAVTRRSMGLKVRVTEEGSSNLVSIPTLTHRYLSQAYDALGTPQDKAQWSKEWKHFTVAMNTGKMPLDLCVQAMQVFVHQAIARLNIMPRTNPADTVLLKSFSQAVGNSTPEEFMKMALIRFSRDFVAYQRQELALKHLDIQQAVNHIATLAPTQPSTAFVHRDFRQRGDLTADEILTLAQKMDDDEPSIQPLPNLNVHAPPPLKKTRRRLPPSEQQKLVVSSWAPTRSLSISLPLTPSPAEVFIPTPEPLALELKGFSRRLESQRGHSTSFIKEQTEALGRAVGRGDVLAAGLALQLKADPNGLVGSNDRMLHRMLSKASLRGAESIVEMLLEAGADPYLKDKAGQSAMNRSTSPTLAQRLQDWIDSKPLNSSPPKPQ